MILGQRWSISPPESNQSDPGWHSTGPGANQSIPRALLLRIPADFIEFLRPGCAGDPPYLLRERFRHLIHCEALRLPAREPEPLQPRQHKSGHPRVPASGLRCGQGRLRAPKCLQCLRDRFAAPHHQRASQMSGIVPSVAKACCTRRPILSDSRCDHTLPWPVMFFCRSTPVWGSVDEERP